MYEHKGFIALLRFAYPRSSGSTGYRNEERRKTGTPKPVYYSKRGLVLRTRLGRRKKPAEPAYFLPGFIRGQATTDNTNRAFVGYQSCDVFVDEHCFRLMSLFSLFEFWKFRRWRLFAARGSIFARFFLHISENAVWFGEVWWFVEKLIYWRWNLRFKSKFTMRYSLLSVQLFTDTIQSYWHQ